MLIAGFSALVIGFIFIISYPYNKRRNNRCTEETQGKLLDIRRRYNSKGRISNAYVYSYFVDGVEYHLKTVDRSQVAKNIGDSCPIWYNPKKPQDAAAYRGADDYLKKLLIIGIVITVVGVVLIIIGLSQL